MWSGTMQWNLTYSLPKVKMFLFCHGQVIPKMTTGIASEVDNLLGNRPHSKKDYNP